MSRKADQAADSRKEKFNWKPGDVTVSPPPARAKPAKKKPKK